MASRINSTRAFHRFQVDVDITTAIAFDELCIAQGRRATECIRKMIESEVATHGDKTKRKK